jgi:hypothetical protein
MGRLAVATEVDPAVVHGLALAYMAERWVAVAGVAVAVAGWQ